MSSPSKDKGNRFERQIVKDIEGSGRKAKRAWGSNGEALGEHAEVDLLFYGESGQKYKVQAKCRKNIAKFLKPSEHVDMQVVKEDRGTTYAIIELGKLLEIIK